MTVTTNDTDPGAPPAGRRAVDADGRQDEIDPRDEGGDVATDELEPADGRQVEPGLDPAAGGELEPDRDLADERRVEPGLDPAAEGELEPDRDLADERPVEPGLDPAEGELEPDRDLADERRVEPGLDPAEGELERGRHLADEPDGSVEQGREPVEAQQSSTDITATQPATDPSPPVDSLRLQDATSYETRLDEIQAGFVDDPRDAVVRAGNLLTELMDELTRALATEVADLEHQGGEDTTSTEELRVAFRRFRSVFDRLVAT